VLQLGTQPPVPRKEAQQLPPHFWAHVYFGPYLLWPSGRPSQQLLSSCLERLHQYVYRNCKMHSFYLLIL